VKTITVGDLCDERIIQKPVVGTVQIAVDSVLADNVHVDHSTGVITFAEDAVPAFGAVITAGFEFDIPCRFESDQLLIHYQHGDLGSFTVPLVEVRLPLVPLSSAVVFNPLGNDSAELIEHPARNFNSFL
jgi:uncharacterized protein (TIGR02217 family)